MKKKYFGTDGIRGTAYEFPINKNFLFNLAKAIKITFNDTKRVLIGMDTRESCEFIKDSIISGFKFCNVDCDSLGIVSTPILCFYTKNNKYDMGIMISASHNPYKDNGVKIFKKNGEKLTDDEEFLIEKNITFEKNVKIDKIITKSPFHHFNEYKKFLFKKISLPKKRINNKIVVDCANGSLFDFAPDLFRSLNYNLITYGCNPNGNNINKNCGALEQKRLSNITLSSKANLGISFDGDADRVIICDNMGKIVDGDYILAIIAYHLRKKNKKELSFVSTKMSNLAFRKYLKKLNINLFLTDVGDRYVVEKMKKIDAFVGGEQSGHIIFSNDSYCGDGILTALYILCIVEEEKKDLSTLCNLLFTKTPQKLINFKLNNFNNDIINSDSVLDLITKYEELGCDILLRKSGTENVLRLMIQSDNKKYIEDFIKIFSKDILNSYAI